MTRLSTRAREEEFYWINRVNLVELGGPFRSVKAAQADAVEAARSVGTIFRDVIIVKVVAEGSVDVKQRWVTA